MYIIVRQFITPSGCDESIYAIKFFNIPSIIDIKAC